ncbi:glycoside hydrolase [Cubamyces sp. BRFM 1775]|nr:glycoside hydrolase [Cubamyces sp. BRFM 1775]
MLPVLSSLLLSCLAAAFVFALVVRAVPYADSPVRSRVPVEAAQPKLVVARHIVGLTGGGGPGDYVNDTWENDMTLAFSKGIDAFALSVGADDFTFDQVDLAYTAAENLRLGFTLFLSLDMAAINATYDCSTWGAARYIRNLTRTFIGRSSQLVVFDDSALVSAVSGENCTFGEEDAATGWETQFTGHPDLAEVIYFVPAFAVDPESFGDFADVINGDFNYNGSWQTNLTTSATGYSEDLGQLTDGVNMTVQQQDTLFGLLNYTFDSDERHIQGLINATNSTQSLYMTSVSPWFFTHSGPQLENNSIFDCDDHLFVRRWQNIIDHRDQVDIVQLVSWNDYGESHYMGPIEGNIPPEAQYWTFGYDHQGFLEVVSYFSEWFKTGEQPAILNDQILMWARPHAQSAKASDDPLPPPANYQLVQDQLWAVVFAAAPANATLATADTVNTTFQIDSTGLYLYNTSLTPDGYMRGTLERDGEVVVDIMPPPEEYTFRTDPSSYNFNVFVALGAAL